LVLEDTKIASKGFVAPEIKIKIDT